MESLIFNNTVKTLEQSNRNKMAKLTIAWVIMILKESMWVITNVITHMWVIT